MEDADLAAAQETLELVRTTGVEVQDRQAIPSVNPAVLLDNHQLLIGHLTTLLEQIGEPPQLHRHVVGLS